MITIQNLLLHWASQSAMNTVHFSTRIRFALVLRKTHFTLDDEIHICGICIVMIRINETKAHSRGFIGASISQGNDSFRNGTGSLRTIHRKTFGRIHSGARTASLAEVGRANIKLWYFRAVMRRQRIIRTRNNWRIITGSHINVLDLITSLSALTDENTSRRKTPRGSASIQEMLESRRKDRNRQPRQRGTSGCY